MKSLNFLLGLLLVTGLFFGCSKDDAGTLKNDPKINSITKRYDPDRSFPIEDLRFQPSQEDMDYFGSIKDRVQNENTVLNDLSNLLYFGEVMWDAPKVIRNSDAGVIYTFIPVFEPTYYEVSYFFGIKDYGGTLTYQLKSGAFVRSSILDDEVDYNVVNSANLFAYFDYNFGFTDSPVLYGPLDDGGGHRNQVWIASPLSMSMMYYVHAEAIILLAK